MEHDIENGQRMLRQQFGVRGAKIVDDAVRENLRGGTVYFSASAGEGASRLSQIERAEIIAASIRRTLHPGNRSAFRFGQ